MKTFNGVIKGSYFSISFTSPLKYLNKTVCHVFGSPKIGATKLFQHYLNNNIVFIADQKLQK